LESQHRGGQMTQRGAMKKTVESARSLFISLKHFYTTLLLGLN
jgi:hypothetical protein